MPTERGDGIAKRLVAHTPFLVRLEQRAVAALRSLAQLARPERGARQRGGRYEVALPRPG